MDDITNRENGENFYLKQADLISDRFVGREDILNQLGQILQYTKRGKPMPIVSIHGSSGMGKTWLMSKFSQELLEEKIPFIHIDIADPNIGAVTSFLLKIADSAKKLCNIKTTNFDALWKLYAKRYLGFEPVIEEQTGFFEGIIRTFRGETDSESDNSEMLQKKFDLNSESSYPVSDHYKAMAKALAEDLDNGLGKRKYPFLTLFIDNWDSPFERFQSHYFTLFENSMRLLVIISTHDKINRGDIIHIPLGSFDEGECKKILNRRGIQDSFAQSRIFSSTGGNPLSLSMAASLADAIARKGDIIKSNTFDIPEGLTTNAHLANRIWQMLRENEKFAVAAAIKVGRIDIENLTKLFPKKTDLVEGLCSASSFVPFDPPLNLKGSLKIQSLAARAFAKLSHDKKVTNKIELGEKARRFGRQEKKLSWMLKSIELELLSEPRITLSRILEEIIRRKKTGNYDISESLWKACRIDSNQSGLSTLHTLVGYSILFESLEIPQIVKMLERVSFSDTVFEHIRLIHIAKGKYIIGEHDDAIEMLQGIIGNLSSAITETSGANPSLWFLRGMTLHLLADYMCELGVHDQVLTAAQKSSESYYRSIEAGLDTAGLVSECAARVMIVASQAERALGEFRSANKWLEKATGHLNNAIEKREYYKIDLINLVARISFLRGDMHNQLGNTDQAEDFYSDAIEKLKNIESKHNLTDPESILLIGQTYLSLANLLSKCDSEDMAYENIGLAENAFSRYQEMSTGGLARGYIGRGEALLLKSELLSVDNNDRAISAAREAEDFFKKASELPMSSDAKTKRIEALISIGNLLSEDDKSPKKAFDLANRLIDEKGNVENNLSYLKLRIKLNKAKGKSCYMQGKNDIAARYFAGAIRDYSILNNLAPELGVYSDVGDLQLGCAVAQSASGDSYQAFQSLIRAEDAFENAANETTAEGRHKVLHAAIQVYNDLAASGRDELAFEVALFILELCSQVGGTEILEIGQELLIHWEAQELTPGEKRKLRRASAVIREQIQ